MKNLMFLLPVAALCWFCSSADSLDPVSKGPGSETTNGIVALVDGNPAQFAMVALRKADYVVNEGEVSNALVQPTVYADSNGVFVLDSADSSEEFRLTVVHGGSAFSQVLSGAELYDVDSVNLVPTGVLSGAVKIPEGTDRVLVGVLGTDLLVKSDTLGHFSMQALPTNDSLQVYFMNEESNKVFKTAPVKLSPNAPEKLNLLDSLKDDSKFVAKFVAVIDGKAVPYAQVALRPVDAMLEEAEVKKAIVDADFYADAVGKFNFALPDSGTFRMTVTAAGFAYSKELKVKNIAALDTVELKGTASLSSNVTLTSTAKFAWIGVSGLDVMVKTDESGVFTLPALPAEDSLELYVFNESFDSLLVTEKVKLAASASSNFSPSMIFQDFESDMDEWYISTDTIGSTVSSKDVAKSIVKDSSRKSKVLNAKYSLVDNTNAWVLTGSTIKGVSWNFSEMDSVAVWVKGSGQIRLSLENWDLMKELSGAAYKAASVWKDIDSTKWQRVVFKTSELCFTAYDLFDCSLSWNAVKSSVLQMHFFVRYGTEISIDDIEFFGAIF